MACLGALLTDNLADATLVPLSKCWDEVFVTYEVKCVTEAYVVHATVLEAVLIGLMVGLHVSVGRYDVTSMAEKMAIRLVFACT